MEKGKGYIIPVFVILCITIFVHHTTSALIKDANYLMEYDAIVIGAGISGLAAAQVF